MKTLRQSDRRHGAARILTNPALAGSKHLHFTVRAVRRCAEGLLPCPISVARSGGGRKNRPNSCTILI